VEKIEHFIVLVLENRSFDHMLGYLDHPNPKFLGVGKTQQPLTTKDARYAIYPGPGHSHHDAMQQILGLTPDQLPSYPNDAYQPTMSGFADNYHKYANGHGSKVLRCFDPAMVPVLSTLALEFAVCDRWFCSLPGETFPNRDFLHAAQSHGRVGVKIGTLKAPTIFEVLDNVNRTWGVYFHNEAQVLLYNYVRKQFLTRLKGHDTLIADIRKNRLPSYAFVEPDYGLYPDGRGNSQHPSQACSREEFVDGEAFIARIYNALRETPAVFEKTAFIITYDEHGGFYDHVPPPRALEPNTLGAYENGTYKFGFRLLGPRVPAVVVSPWIKRHTIDNRVHDHSSIPETLRQRFAPNTPALTRRTGTYLDNLFSLPTARTGADLPVVSPLSHERAKQLEQALAAKPDASDLSPKIDFALQGNLRKVGEFLAKNVGAPDLPYGV